MKNLNNSEIDQVGGGYMRLTDIEEFTKRNNNSFKGGILHTALNSPVFKEKKFPAPPYILDFQSRCQVAGCHQPATYHLFAKI